MTALTVSLGVQPRFELTLNGNRRAANSAASHQINEIELPKLSAIVA
jgi:hypothetical protein